MSNFIFGEEQIEQLYRAGSGHLYWDIGAFCQKSKGVLKELKYIHTTSTNLILFNGSQISAPGTYRLIQVNKTMVLIMLALGQTLYIGLSKFNGDDNNYRITNIPYYLIIDTYADSSSTTYWTNINTSLKIKWCVNTRTEEWTVVFEFYRESDSLKRSYTYMGVLMNGQINIITPNGGMVDPEGNDLGYTALCNFGGQSSPLITNQMSMISMIRRHNALYTLTEDINDFNLAVCYPGRETIMNFSDKATGNEYILIPRINVGKSGIVMMEGGSYA